METVYYLGACTPSGFFSHYDALLREVRRLTVLKGGAGCGKSTFLRAVGRAARERGLDVSYILCSSDPDSLDAVILPSLSAAFVDGTAPHVLEPKICGGSMNYLNFGEFYDAAGMQANEEELLQTQRKNAAQYPLVTACLSSANELLGCVRSETARTAYDEEMASIAECLALSSLKPHAQSPLVRHRFLSAVTPKGLRLCSQTPSALCSRVYVLRDDYGLAPRLLGALLQKAESLGHECVVCHSPLLPDGQPVHLLLPTAQTAFVSESHDFPYDGPSFCRIDLNSTLPPDTRSELEFCRKTVTSLLYQAVSHLREAKRLHDRMEQLCRPFVDFAAVDAKTEQFISDFFA